MTKKIAIIGPESTGKTTLTNLLAKEYQAVLVKEYAREYLKQLEAKYTFEDVLVMAKKQLSHEMEAKGELIFLDTDLTVFHVWIREKYNKEVDWIEAHIKKQSDKVYLLCDIDIEWEHDPLREHPQKEDRKRLFNTYRELLDRNDLTYYIISGNILTRIKKCKEIIDTLI